jgi:hypothetical protein
MRNNKLALTLAALTCILSACAALLPHGKSVVTTPWKSFDEAKVAYDKVEVNKSSTGQMKKIGFNIYSTQNVHILNYLDIAATTQSIKPEELSAGLSACMKAQDRCRGYVFEPKAIKIERYSNVILDLLEFNRKTRSTGWRFKALFVVVDDVVLEKFWSGDPSIHEDDQRTNPLGPIQDGVGSRVIKFVPFF